VDERAAVEARMRQLKASNERLERQMRLLRRRLSVQLMERRREDTSDEI
jgi:cell division protein FtsB